jgi:hypothetical protein
MAILRLVLDVSGVDCDTTSFLFGRLVNLRVVGESRAACLRKNLGDGGSQGCLSMVNVAFKQIIHIVIVKGKKNRMHTNSTNVHVRLGSVEGIGIRTRCSYI